MQSKSLIPPLQKQQQTEAVEGFVIKSIELKDFMMYGGKVKIEFPQSLTAITGATGAGKTTLLDAITFALYKKTSRTEVEGINIADIFGERGGYVKLIFTDGKHEYEIRRGCDSSGNNYAELRCDGKIITTKIKEVDNYIKDTIIGLDFKSFCRATFIRQGEMKLFGEEKPKEILELLKKLFQYDMFTKAEKVAKEKFGEFDYQLKAIVETIRMNEDRIVQEHERYNTILKELAVKYTKLMTKKNDLERKITDLEKKLKQLEPELEEYLRLHTFKQQQEAELRDCQNELKTLQVQLEKSKNLQEEFKRCEEQLQEVENKLNINEKRIRELESDHEHYLKLDSKSDELQKNIEKLKVRRKKLEADLERYDKLTMKIESLSKSIIDIEKKEREYEVLRDKREHYQILNAKYEAELKQLKTLRENFEKRKNDIELYIAEEKKKLAQTPCELDHIEGFNYLREEGRLEERVERIDKELEWLKDNKELVEKLRIEQAEAYDRLEFVKSKTAKINKYSFVLSEIKEKLKSAQENLEEHKRTYEANIEKLEAICKKLEAELNQLGFTSAHEKLLRNLKLQIDSLKAKRREIENLIAERERLGNPKERIQELDEELATRKNEFESNELQRSNLYKNEITYQNLHKDLENLKKQKAELTTRRTELEPKVASISTIETKIADYESKCSNIRANLQDINEKYQKKEVARKNYECLENELEQKKTELQTIHEELGRCDGMRKSTLEQLERLNNERKQIEKLKNEKRELETKCNIYEKLKTKIFHDRGIVQYAVGQLIQNLPLKASELLAEFTDDRLRYIKMEIKPPAEGKQRGEYGIEISVLGDEGKWRPIKSFSGGEQTQISAAIRLAIARELAVLSQTGKRSLRMRTLFIDEGDLSSLDTEGSRTRFVDKLLSLQKWFDKIIVITHLEDVADRFEHRLHVSRGIGGNARIEVKN